MVNGRPRRRHPSHRRFEDEEDNEDDYASPMETL